LPCPEQSDRHRNDAPFGLCTAVFTSSDLDISRLPTPTPSCFVLPGCFAGFETKNGYKYYVYASSESNPSGMAWVTPTTGMVHPIHTGLSLVRVTGTDSDCGYQWARTGYHTQFVKEEKVANQDTQLLLAQLDELLNRFNSTLKFPTAC
jgi:hypothetical protein